MWIIKKIAMSNGIFFLYNHNNKIRADDTAGGEPWISTRGLAEMSLVVLVC